MSDNFKASFAQLRIAETQLHALMEMFTRDYMRRSDAHERYQAYGEIGNLAEQISDAVQPLLNEEFQTIERMERQDEFLAQEHGTDKEDPFIYDATNE